MLIDDLIEILETVKRVSNEGYDHIWDIEDFDTSAEEFTVVTCKGYKEYGHGSARTNGPTKRIKISLHIEDNKLQDRSVEDDSDEFFDDED